MKNKALASPPGAQAAAPAADKPARGRPRDPERLQRILEAANKHFREHGFERASMDAIAKDAGVSKMTVYSHFDSKELLLEAVIAARTEGAIDDMTGAQQKPLDPLHPEQALTTVGKEFLALMRDDNVLGQFRNAYGVAGRYPDACLGFYRQGAEKLIGQLAAYLVLAQQAGTLKVPKPRQAADIFLAMFLGDGHIRGMLKLERLSAAEDKALLREAVRVFLAGYAV